MSNFEPEALTLVNQKYLKAGHPATLHDELWMLAVDDIDNVRRRVAENPSCPPEILQALAVDEHPDVRIAVSEHPNVPIDTLEQLSLDDCADVRYTLAENPNIPEHILSRLSDDENPYVSHRAKRTLKIIRPSEITTLKPRSTADYNNRISFGAN